MLVRFLLSFRNIPIGIGLCLLCEPLKKISESLESDQGTLIYGDSN